MNLFGGTDIKQGNLFELDGVMGLVKVLVFGHISLKYYRLFFFSILLSVYILKVQIGGAERLFSF